MVCLLQAIRRTPIECVEEGMLEWLACEGIASESGTAVRNAVDRASLQVVDVRLIRKLRWTELNQRVLRKVSIQLLGGGSNAVDVERDRIGIGQPVHFVHIYVVVCQDGVDAKLRDLKDSGNYTQHQACSEKKARFCGPARSLRAPMVDIGHRPEEQDELREKDGSIPEIVVAGGGFKKCGDQHTGAEDV